MSVYHQYGVVRQYQDSQGGCPSRLLSQTSIQQQTRQDAYFDHDRVARSLKRGWDVVMCIVTILVSTCGVRL